MQDTSMLMKLNITTLGRFSVECNGVILSEDAKRQQQIWTLLKYILINRRRRIPPEEFFDILWPDDSCANPPKALQNLIYRLRRVLAMDKDDAPRYILLKQGCYTWNADAPYHLDIDDFEAAYARGHAFDQGEKAEQAVESYAVCLGLYKGNFLSESSSLEWVVPSANYYKRLYTNMAVRQSELLSALERNGDVLATCEAAFLIEPYDEALHAAFIHALLAMSKPKQARSHYEYITSALYREFGVKPSQVLKDAYHNISESTAASGMDLDVLQELLSEREQASEAFQCEPELFKDIYKLEARRAVRSGQVVYLVLLTVISTTVVPPIATATARAMEHLNMLLSSSLRRGDVVSRWNDAQFVIMLVALTYEDGELVIQRLLAKFKESFGGEGLALKHKLQPLNAVP